MDTKLERKLSSLRAKIKQLDSVLIAYSGGVDSSFLLRICKDELGERAVAVTTISDNYPASELALARRIAKIIDAKHVVYHEDKLSDKASGCAGCISSASFARSPASSSSRQSSGRGGGRRSSAAASCSTPTSPVSGSPAAALAGIPGMCGSVRGRLYSSLKCLAVRLRLKNVIDGSHSDDCGVNDASFIAAKQAGVKSPLLECGLSKAEIRLLAKELGLPNWDKGLDKPRGKKRRQVHLSSSSTLLTLPRTKLSSVRRPQPKPTLRKNCKKYPRKKASLSKR